MPTPPRIDLRLRIGGAVALAILLLFTRWYGVSTPAHGSFGAAGSSAVGGWKALGILRWLIPLALLGVTASLLSPRAAVADVAVLGGLLCTAALLYRLVFVLPDPHAVLDVKVGGYLALVASAALTLGAWEAPAGPWLDPAGQGADASAAATAPPQRSLPAPAGPRR
ncbi:hypothetical protein [Conexibacter sp. DBS9H8]|uniref:hypothetical protein n=1 Tax=Conexibacter sp. DBS9H8 TaxID=2937801 RepID=UPI00200E72C2|nr:hypothetical protein [Conexibacter sp. DBS9H8]